MTLFWERGQLARIAVYAELLTRRDTHKALLISGVGCKSVVRLFLKSSFSLDKHLPQSTTGTKPMCQYRLMV